MGIVLVNGALGRLLDMLGRREVGLPYRKVDHINTLGTQFSAFLRHGQGLRG